MSVVSSDLKFYLTPGSNTDPLLSLGGAGQGSEISAAIDGIFQDVTAAEAAAGKISYRSIVVKNSNVTDTLYGATIWISTETSSADTTSALALDSGTQSVANELAAPSSPTLTFTTPTTQAGGISLGDIAPAGVVRVWLRRTVTAGAVATASDAGALSIGGGTI